MARRKVQPSAREGRNVSRKAAREAVRAVMRKRWKPAKKDRKRTP